MTPTSAVPSAAPSITGSVVFVELNREVSQSLTDAEIAEIVTLAEDTFGVYPGNVEAEVSYEITGTVNADFDGSDYSEEELIVAVQNSIADALSIHSSDVEV